MRFNVYTYSHNVYNTGFYFFIYFLLVASDLSATSSSSSSSNKFSCTKNTNNFKCKLSSLTPYRFIADTTHDSELIIPDCEAKKIWLLIRHGSRYPGTIISKMINQLPHIQRIILNNCQMNKCHLTDLQLLRLANWSLNFSIDDQMILVNEGQDELIGLGERFQSRFPHLMPEKYSNDTYKFKFTASQRTEESAKYFSIGLFGKYQSKNVWYPEALVADPILRFYKLCKRWQQDVSKNVDASAEVEKFKNSTIMIKVLQDLSYRYGYEFNFDVVELIYTICSYETAWYKDNLSPWCELLTLDEFRIMEYIRDLKYYWIDGYGYPLTYKQACTALIDMFDFLDTDNDVKTSAYFTHSGTILKVLSFLGIANDEKPMFHSNYSTSENRLWRTSLIDAFASNIAFVLYDCKLAGPSIYVMHQERFVQLPGCPDNKPCPIVTMKKNYPGKKDKCKFTEMCSIES